ncbi:hypothetical protein B566_EDAN010599, partial [Ephemera danica]
MATLNLRISNNKSRGNSVKTQKAAAPFPASCKRFYSSVKEELQNADSEIAKQFSTLVTEDEHLNLLKQIQRSTGLDDRENVIKIVTAIYLLADYQSHLKNAARKMLELPTLSATKDFIAELTNLLSMCDTLEEQGHAAGTLLHLSKSELCRHIVSECWNDVSSFLSMAIDVHFHHLS